MTNNLYHDKSSVSSITIGSRGFKNIEANSDGHPLQKEHVLFTRLNSISIITIISDYRLGNYSTFNIFCKTIKRPHEIRKFEIKMTDYNKLNELHHVLEKEIQKKNDGYDNLIGI